MNTSHICLDHDGEEEDDGCCGGDDTGLKAWLVRPDRDPRQIALIQFSPQFRSSIWTISLSLPMRWINDNKRTNFHNYENTITRDG